MYFNKFSSLFSKLLKGNLHNDYLFYRLIDRVLIFWCVNVCIWRIVPLSYYKVEWSKRTQTFNQKWNFNEPFCIRVPECSSLRLGWIMLFYTTLQIRSTSVKRVQEVNVILFDSLRCLNYFCKSSLKFSACQRKRT